MKLKKVLALGCTTLVLVSLVSGCAGNKADQTEVVLEEIDETDEDQETGTILQVTAVDGNTITGEIGELAGGGAPGEMGEKPDGEVPDGGGAPGEMGEKPEGEAPDGGGAPGEMGEKPDGEAPDGGGAPGEMGEKPDREAPDGEGQPGGQMGGQPGGSSFQGTGETVSFTITDDTEIIVEFLQGQDAGTIDDIAVGSVLEVELDDEDQAVSITVKNLNAGGGFGGSDEVTNGTAVTTITEDTEEAGGTYTSTGDDENALRVDGASAVLTDLTIEKTAGASSNTENGDFYGQNAAFLALNGAQVQISGATVNTSAANGNGIFSYGEGTVVTISDSVIRTTENNSGGIQTTGGGTMIASNLDIQTEGNSAAAIRSDRGGGTVQVTGGTYVTNGTGSPAIYCTADISVEDAVLNANASEGVVVEGKNNVSLKNCTVTSNMKNTYNGDSDENIHAIMIYQSMSGDAAMGEATFSSEDGSITAKAGDLFYITNTDCSMTLKNTALTLANETLLRIEGNNSSRGWGTSGANGGDVTLNTEDQELTGNILVDDISSLILSMQKSTFTGAINPDGAAGDVQVTLSSDSTWTLTGDSYISGFDGDLSNVSANRYHLYIAGEEAL
jgi:hypothetical protein